MTAEKCYFFTEKKKRNVFRNKKVKLKEVIMKYLRAIIFFYTKNVWVIYTRGEDRVFFIHTYVVRTYLYRKLLFINFKLSCTDFLHIFLRTI